LSLRRALQGSSYGRLPLNHKKGLLPFSGSLKKNGVRRGSMKNEEELVLKVTKEIIVKFIEVGRLSVNSFDDVWNQIHQTVRDSMKQGSPNSER
jgi:hypothetical protein